MQTNPLYVSQLARHVKLPRYQTVQDYRGTAGVQDDSTSSERNVCQVALYPG